MRIIVLSKMIAVLMPLVFQKIDNTRQNIELILELEEPLKSHGKIIPPWLRKSRIDFDITVVAAYGYAFTAVFGLCAIAATVLVISLRRIKVRGFREEPDREKASRV